MNAQPEKSKKLAVLGAGSWGLAVAVALQRQGNRLSVWSRSADTAARFSQERTSPKLPGVTLSQDIEFGSNLTEVVADSEALLLALPTQTIGELIQSNSELFRAGRPLIVLSKGIEKGTLRTISQLIVEEAGGATADDICLLSGPSHAEEVARNIPTSVVAASTSENLTRWTQELFSSETFRVYRSDDVIGVELGGAVKNIIAIASGIAQALKLGDNVQGALITRGLAEMSRLGVKLGANPMTFSGLSGLGDLVTTCFSPHSRNRKVGERIGKGEKLPDIIETLGMVAEGVDTCVAIRELARRHDVETPIIEQVYQTLFGGKEPVDCVRELMVRSLKSEIWI